MLRWLIVAGLAAAAAWAQQAISTRAGLVQRVEGRAQVSDVGPEGLPTNIFVQLEAGQRMRTLRGRAEVFLAPGAYARFGGNSEIELVAAEFSDIEVRLIEGALVADLSEGRPGKDYAVTLLWGDLRVELDKRGEYEIFARPGSPAELRVYEGKATVRSGKRAMQVHGGKELAIDPQGWAETRKLSIDEPRFPLIEWSRRRRAELAQGLEQQPRWTDESPAPDFPPR
ncbi:MAG: hypothetical protein KDC27_18455 [Acidobacteria bacterium]|nr:hypothetical protein [Acidobacteriota bacterium]